MYPKILITIFFFLTTQQALSFEDELSAEEYFGQVIGMVIAAEEARDRCSSFSPQHEQDIFSAYNNSIIKKYSGFLRGTVAKTKSLLGDEINKYIGENEKEQKAWCAESYFILIDNLDDTYRDNFDEFKKNFGPWVAMLDDNVASEERTSKIKIHLYKDMVFCDEKLVENWKKSFFKHCNPNFDRKIEVFLGRETSTEFTIAFTNNVKDQISLANKSPIISFSTLLDKSLKDRLDICLTNSECRLD
ncbi:MAG: hypothetical protein OQK04_11855 [Kangiellaceae bacterium]|nr:hypothetical protein [Kangiellaceae bacterium]MCW8999395.1 hypothetical protein [Kangiellaceae bacterium]